MTHKIFTLLAAGAVLLSATSCESLENASPKKKSMIIGGASGAAIGAIASDNKAKGALIGGALGTGAGYLFGKHQENH
jgi:hypothetical protein